MHLSSATTVLVASVIAGVVKPWQEVTSVSDNIDVGGRSFVRLVYDPKIRRMRVAEEYSLDRHCRCEDWQDDDRSRPPSGHRTVVYESDRERGCTVEKHVSSSERDGDLPDKYASSYEKRTVRC